MINTNPSSSSSHLCTSICHLFAIIWYHIRYRIFLLIAFTINRSFIISHPDHVFPSTITPPWNTTIHSLRPTNQMMECIRNHYTPSYQRRWLSPDRLLQQIPTPDPYTPAIVLEGCLSGPLLREGMVFLQQNQAIYIDKEFGRWPSRDNYITTYAVNISTNISFRLFIPIELMDRYGVFDSAPYSMFCRPLTLIDSTSRPLRLKTSHNSLSSHV